jgi:hypothetical protein
VNKRHKHFHRFAFGWRRTGIGGRSWFLRFYPWSLVVQFCWGVPWGEYVRAVYVTNKRTKLGRKVALRAWKPYLVADLQKAVPRGGKQT